MNELICCLCNAKGPDTKFCIEASAWEWFTGYLPETLHFCPACKNSPKYQALLLASRQKAQALDSKREMHP